jgi:hypothetical protein
MKRFAPPSEPPDFDNKVRQPGNEWLDQNMDENGQLPKGSRPPNRWGEFKSQLADGFDNLCAYSVMYEPVGTVDHYLSCENYPRLAYDWNNYRYVSGWINSSKGTLDEAVLDPFQVNDDWFEILLPSLQLVLTDTVPQGEQERAGFTLEKLHLRDDERVIRQRRQWYQMYQDGKLSLDGLGNVAPLVARAVRKQLVYHHPDHPTTDEGIT